MNEQDKQEFLNYLTAVNELLASGKPLSELAAKLYCKKLMPYSLDKIKDAFDKILDVHKYKTMPNPAEIIELIQQANEHRARNQPMIEYKNHNTIEMQDQLGKNREFFKTLDSDQKKAWKDAFLKSDANQYSKTRVKKQNFEKLGNNPTFLLFLKNKKKRC